MMHSAKRSLGTATITRPALRHAMLRAAMLAGAMLLGAACDRAPDSPPGATLNISELLGGADTLHERAVTAREFTFPRDHGSHPGFRTEWWYFTGNLTAEDGREIGYQLTFFRSALTDSASYAAGSRGRADTGSRADAASRADTTTQQRSAWRTRHAWMAHFAVTDGGTGEFRAAEKFARGAAGLAGVTVSRENTLRIWLEDWSAASTSPAATFPIRLRADAGDIAIDLVLDSGKPIVLQGDRGVSRKGAEPGNASYYYSLTRMPTRGSVRTSAGTWNVQGSSWLDREWSTSVLSPGVTGWDWLSLQLSDSTELMMFRLRRDDNLTDENGMSDPFSAATFIDVDGGTRGFAADEFRMSPTATWRSADGVAYPVAWRVEIPALDLALEVSTPVEDQELHLAVRYWEGMVRARGTQAGRVVNGRGYLEMTGYSGTAPDRTR